MTSSGVKKTGAVKEENEVPVVKEDQEKINKFACLSARLFEVTEEIKLKKKEVEEMSEAESEVWLSEQEQLFIPYKLGEIFVDMDPEGFQKILLERKEIIKKETEEFETQKDEIKEEICELKIALYGKFGDSINLEPDEN